MKTNTVFKRAHNQSLSRLSAYAIGSHIGSEPHWAQALAVSRTTVRAVMAALAAKGVLAQEGRRKGASGRPTPADLNPKLETEQVGSIVQKRFMKWILEGDRKPGQLNGLDLARQFGVSTSAIRDYLNPFSQFGLLQRRPSGGWAFKGFTIEFAEELFEVWEMFELRSAQRSSRSRPTTRPRERSSESSRSISICFARRTADLLTSPSSTSGFIASSTTHRATASSSVSTISYR